MPPVDARRGRRLNGRDFGCPVFVARADLRADAGPCRPAQGLEPHVRRRARFGNDDDAEDFVGGNKSWGDYSQNHYFANESPVAMTFEDRRRTNERR